MGLLSSIPILSQVIDGALEVVDDFVEDKDQANKLKANIKEIIEQNSHKEIITKIKSQTKIVLGEVEGESWLQRNWRPLGMIAVISVVVNNYILVPYIGAIFPKHVHVLELPSGLWALFNAGFGGYIGGRTVEKIFKNKDKKK
jgi:hypothetical protein